MDRLQTYLYRLERNIIVLGNIDQACLYAPWRLAWQHGTEILGRPDKGGRVS